ncbi:GNAT family N-acetyltransferase [Thermohalobacter berrensis]|uniref:N-acetyltransferase domain-containing protein n=1 Tax=Thermohalobacter berrensis TaxID=99594 RepID=A0A419T9W7_9FIRM|nr:GNAT family N-acetyltransferase [Thermohalobacter berrensis]RKD34258.1 hypothetical protein BET03_00040 [Thermohalobacter berrensis]
MIRLLNDNDYNLLMDYVKREKEINLFIIGDVENYGFNQDFQKVWGDFDDNGKLKGVLLKYRDSFVVYSRDDYDLEGFYNIMIKEDFKMLSGEKAIIERFEKLHNFSKKRETYFSKLDSMDKLENKNQLFSKVERINEEDAEDIANLYDLIDEFTTEVSVENLKKEIKEGFKRGYCIKDKGKIISVAQTTAENSSSAMIVGVCTHPDYRKKGYASACMNKLCRELLSEGKTLCLFYDNPNAGKIYKRLGFEDIGKWLMYNK